MNTKELFLRKWTEYNANDIKNLQAKGERDYLKDFFVLAKHFGVETVLDAGCGEGYHIEVYTKHGLKVTGIDLNTKQVLERKANNPLLSDVEIFEGNIEALPFPDNSFDAVICSGVLHHTDYKKTMPELKRVARKMLYFGVYGNRGRSFRACEVLLRFFLSKIPYSFNRFVLKGLGFSNRFVAQRLEHIYIERADRFSERQLAALLGDEYFCVFNRVRNWINCNAIKKNVLSDVNL